MNHLNQSFQKNGTAWQAQFFSTLSDHQITFESIGHQYFHLISLNGGTLTINLVNIENPYVPADLLLLSSQLNLIHLWEDVWLSRPKQVVFRLLSLLGLNSRIHGRKTLVKKIDKPDADAFLNENHLQGAVNSRVKLGLFVQHELMGVATFSALRRMNHTENYRSAELIRFAIKGGYSINGGLSKLIKHFAIQYKSNDLMTYADRDWTAGEVYGKLGFEFTGVLKPQYFHLDKSLKRQSLKIDSHGPLVFNTGSIKYILKF